MAVPVALQSPNISAPAPALVRLPMVWLLFLALAFCINASSFGSNAAAGSGFVSQAEHLVFAGGGDNGRFLPRFADIQHSGDASPDTQWLAIAPRFGSVVLPLQTLDLARLAQPVAPYRANFYQQAPRAPPFV